MLLHRLVSVWSQHPKLASIHPIVERLFTQLSTLCITLYTTLALERIVNRESPNRHPWLIHSFAKVVRLKVGMLCFCNFLLYQQPRHFWFENIVCHWYWVVTHVDGCSLLIYHTGCLRSLLVNHTCSRTVPGLFCSLFGRWSTHSQTSSPTGFWLISSASADDRDRPWFRTRLSPSRQARPAPHASPRRQTYQTPLRSCVYLAGTRLRPINRHFVWISVRYCRVGIGFLLGISLSPTSRSVAVR